ncbi:MAG: HPF/RaiA family ribosome-associated protein [Pseudobacteriovorax sp.]|nr:HPF/RaiA family ribosome-associated protein [Pseudobacteriovorax sp.]
MESQIFFRNCQKSIRVTKLFEHTKEKLEKLLPKGVLLHAEVKQEQQGIFKVGLSLVASKPFDFHVQVYDQTIFDAAHKASHILIKRVSKKKIKLSERPKQVDVPLLSEQLNPVDPDMVEPLFPGENQLPIDAAYIQGFEKMRRKSDAMNFQNMTH